MMTTMTRDVFFIHIPKCAGISVHQACPDAINHWHADCDYYARQYGERWQTGFKFAVVRHPFDRFVSAFSYLKQQTPAHRFWEDDRQRRKALEPFDNINAAVNGAADFVHMLHFRPQRSWLGNWLPDFILHFERLAEDWRALQTLFPSFASLAKLNASQHADYRTLLTPQSRQQLGRWYAEDLRLFGYTD